jgi:antitoxin (DNA-binding transcriptional repressor) of toxin-antitoxin stability system
MKVSAQYAQEHLPELLTAASSGEEVEIEVQGQPTLILVQRRVQAPFKRNTPRILGAGVGELRVPDFEEWQAI